jgi:hypothetical protein
VRHSSPSTDPRLPPTRTDDAELGSASLEFILGGVLLLVPLVYLVTALGLIQGHALGAEAGARHIARTVATADGAADARERAERVLAFVVEEYRLDAESVHLDYVCRPSGVTCPQAGATLVVTLTSRVPLPLVPPVFGWERSAAIPVEATAAQRVSRFWGAP